MNASGMAQTTDDGRSSASTAAAVPVSGESSPHGLLPRLWPLFVAIWLVFLITGPVATMLATAPSPARMLATLAWTLAFLTAYLWLMLYRPFHGSELTLAERRVQAGLLVVLTGLVLYVDLAFPAGMFWVFIYVVLPAGIVLPTRAAVWTLIAITVLAAGVEATRTDLGNLGAVLGISIWGVSSIMLRRLVVTVDELRAAREELARLAIAEERLRFARDLHDLLGHSLSLIALKSELAGRLARTDGGRAAAEIADVERVARRALREMREAVAGYRRPTLDDELAGVRDLLTAAGIETRIDAAPGPLPPAVDAALAWTVREGATNVIRHSGARHCTIRVRRDDDILRAEVLDDGRGPPAHPADPAGSGLSGLAERVAEAGGRLAAGPDAGGGFRLEVVLPITDERPEGSHRTFAARGRGGNGAGRR